MSYFNPYKNRPVKHTHKHTKHNTLPDYNLSKPLGPPKYRVRYHLNNDDIVYLDAFIIDNNVYCPGDVVTLQGHSNNYFSTSGLYEYKFLGWALSKGQSFVQLLEEGTEITIGNKDIDLYAQWDKETTLELVQYTHTGLYEHIKLKDKYKTSLTHIIIPEYLNGYRITGLASGAFMDSNVASVTIPASISFIRNLAFARWSGHTINFVDAEVTTKYPHLRIARDAFRDTPNLKTILFPYRAWDFKTHVGSDPVIDETANTHIEIYIRNTKDFLAEVNDYPNITQLIAAPNNPSIGFSTKIYWGYNK